MTYPNQVRKILSEHPEIRTRNDWRRFTRGIPQPERKQIQNALSYLIGRGFDPFRDRQATTNTESDHNLLCPHQLPGTLPVVPQERSYPTGLDGFRSLYDKSKTIPEKIKKAIETSLKKVGWMYDDDFRRACGVKTNDWRRFSREFDHLQIRVEGGLVWAHPDIVEQCREVALA